MTKRITVGFDGSPSSTAAVQWAAHQADRDGASLRIVTCTEMPAVGSFEGVGYPEWQSALTDSARRRVEEVAAAVRADHAHLDVTTAAPPGPPGPALVEGLDPDDLVVVGSSHHTGASAFWLGSTPRSVVHHSPCPVAIVRGQATGGRATRVVVGVDGSAMSDDGLTWAADEADRNGAELIVVHGWAYPYPTTDPGGDQGRDIMRVDAACVLDAAVETATARCASPVTGRLVEAVSPVAALLQTVRDGDLLVVGSHGRGGIANAILGSTVNAVLDRCAAPTVVVRPVDRAAR